MPERVTCEISGEEFVVSDHEIALRAKYGFNDLPKVKPKHRLQYLGAFYPMWNLHNRKCDKTEQDIVSVFRSDCPYPVWHKDVWHKEADPPKAQFDFERPFFEQAWELFPKCPIPHIAQLQCENCEYADDWYRSRDCYLCHGGQDCEGVRYCHATTETKDSIYCMFCQHCNWCIDCVNCEKSHSCIYCLDCRNTDNCAFSYNLRNCSDCLFCFNLRGKKYCIGNQQLTKEQYQEEYKKWNLKSVEGYEKARGYFRKMVSEIAWLRAQYIEHCENSSGNFLVHCKDCENCFMTTYHENCFNDFSSGPHVKHTCDALGTIGCQGGFQVTLPANCFEVRMTFMSFECRFADYMAYCIQCENCFGCCGLHRIHNAILNTVYSKEEFSQLQERIIDHMKQTGEWGQFFPGYFSPNPYDESISSYYWPLDKNQQEERGFRTGETLERRQAEYREIKDIPDDPNDADEETTKQTFWDETAGRPFGIIPNDVNFCRKLEVALPDRYYMRRMQENFSWMWCDGELRETTCAKSGKKILTSWSAEFDGRILCEEEYLKLT